MKVSYEIWLWTEAGKKKRIKEALEKLGQIDDIKIHRK